MSFNNYNLQNQATLNAEIGVGGGKEFCMGNLLYDSNFLKPRDFSSPAVSSLNGDPVIDTERISFCSNCLHMLPIRLCDKSFHVPPVADHKGPGLTIGNNVRLSPPIKFFRKVRALLHSLDFGFDYLIYYGINILLQICNKNKCNKIVTVTAPIGVTNCNRNLSLMHVRVKDEP